MNESVAEDDAARGRPICIGSPRCRMCGYVGSASGIGQCRSNKAEGGAVHSRIGVTWRIFKARRSVFRGDSGAGGVGFASSNGWQTDTPQFAQGKLKTRYLSYRRAVARYDKRYLRAAGRPPFGDSIRDLLSGIRGTSIRETAVQFDFLYSGPAPWPVPGHVRPRRSRLSIEKRLKFNITSKIGLNGRRVILRDSLSERILEVWNCPGNWDSASIDRLLEWGLGYRIEVREKKISISTRVTWGASRRRELCFTRLRQWSIFLALASNPMKTPHSSRTIAKSLLFYTSKKIDCSSRVWSDTRVEGEWGALDEYDRDPSFSPESWTVFFSRTSARKLTFPQLER